MSEEIQNPTAQVTAAPKPAVPAQPTQPVPAANAALNAGATPAQPAQSVPTPQPYKIDRLGENKDFTYTDKNGYVWHYTLQFPGLKKMYEILDSSNNDNGTTSQSKLYENYLKFVVVKPAGLTIDSFNTIPGFSELMNAADTFCGERISL
ncbi:hypothetical protein [Lacticaseibacillus zhaodongensis]|uniref:hypothetical protein n=1 Tax=Lacticaseibacillus zhaodongensis TaxID=2668065 RepID=UPI001E2D7DF5|nr:hypothetical protein [Lacticaseibacillus zhaodongensis]